MLVRMVLVFGLVGAVLSGCDDGGGSSDGDETSESEEQDQDDSEGDTQESEDLEQRQSQNNDSEANRRSAQRSNVQDSDEENADSGNGAASESRHLNAAPPSNRTEARNDLEAPSSEQETFVAYCEGQDGGNGVSKTVSALKDASGKTDCAEAFQALSEMKSLDLSNLELSNLEPILTMKTIVSLNLAGNKFESIEALNALPKLQYLNVSSNPLERIAGVDHVIQLDVRATPAAAVISLYDLPVDQVVYAEDGGEPLYLGSDRNVLAEIDEEPQSCKDKWVVFETEPCRDERHETEDKIHARGNVILYSECRHPAHGWERFSSETVTEDYAGHPDFNKYAKDEAVRRVGAQCEEWAMRVALSWVRRTGNNGTYFRSYPQNIRHSGMTCSMRLVVDRALVDRSHHCGEAEEYEQQPMSYSSPFCPENGVVRFVSGFADKSSFDRVGPSVCNDCSDVDVTGPEDIESRLQCYDKILNHEGISSPYDLRALQDAAAEFGRSKAKWMNADNAAYFWRLPIY